MTQRKVNARRMLPRARYIQLIHIGKSRLNLDDETYRSILMGCTQKNSCKGMSEQELERVLMRLKDMGFKPISKNRSNAKYSPKSSDKKAFEKTQLDKLRQVWIEMNKAGFLRDGSEQGLLTWSKGQAKRFNKNEEVEKLEWLNPRMLHHLIEQLKQWQKRSELAKKRALRNG